MMSKCYSELIKIDTFEDRYKYLRLRGIVGESTFGFDRYLNQILYKTPYWRKARDEVIIRDNSCDLGVKGYDIFGRVIIHHMNPIDINDIRLGNKDLYNPEFLVCVSHNTHMAIHYGDESLLRDIKVIERYAGDQTPWLKRR